MKRFPEVGRTILAAVLIGYLLTLPLAGQSAPLSIGSEKQLFLDQRLIQSSRNVELVLNLPEQPRENLILKDRPWEQGRAGGYAHVLRDGALYRMYYNSFDRSYRVRYFCLALSHDGVHWTKPNLGLIPYAGKFDTNIIGLDVFGSPFIDLFDTPDRRYKLYTRVGRARGERDHLIQGDSTGRGSFSWPPARDADPQMLYLLYSGDGVYWQRDPEPVMPFYVGAPTSVFWDETPGLWAIYPRAYLPRSRVRVYSRTTAGKHELGEAFDLDLMSAARRQLEEQRGSRITGLLDELPVVLKPDRQDPDGMQVYTFYAYNYPAQDAYVAFPSMWYSRRPDDFERVDPGASDTLEVQFTFSRDGIRWQRPFRQPLISLGPPGSAWQHQIYGAGLVQNGDQLHFYYNGLPSRHMSGDLSLDWTCVTARAIFRLDGFVSADAAYEGGELTTPLLTFTGSRLQYNAKTGGGGFIRTEILDSSGTPIPGFSLAESHRVNGNSVRHLASWKGSADVSSLAGQPVRLRLVMRDAKLYALQFVR